MTAIIFLKNLEIFKILLLFILKKAYRIYFLCMIKCKAKKIMTNSNLINKKVIL